MENSYGIGIANRYDLFYVQDEAGDPFETLVKKKAKTQKTKLTTTAATGAEKENKSATLNKNQKEDQNTKLANTTATARTDKQQANGGSAAQSTQPQQNQQRRGIKDTQNFANKNQDSRLAKDDIKTKNDRGNFKSGDGNRDREERNNRRNREDRVGQNGTLAEGGNFEKSRRQGGGGGGGGGGRRNFDGRGKREFDRQSGSDKTGIKAVDKRDGAGAHNWGSHKQDLDDLNKLSSDYATDGETKDGKEDSDSPANEQEPVEEEVKEMTLDEWKAQRQANRLKPQYNLRMAGEGEDTQQWKKMVVLDKKRADNEQEKEDQDHQQRTGKQKQLLDIEFHFNDGRRGGGLGRGGRGRGRGPGGRPNRNRNNEDGTNNTRPHEEGQERERGERGGNSGGGGGVGNSGAPGNNRRRGNRFDRHDRDGGQNAPKVDDERDFPSLG